MEEDLIKFVIWTKLKIRIHLKPSESSVYFSEREIWWSSLGVNIGYEQDGKNDNFERPILILKKFSKNVLWVLPLTRTKKTDSKYYFQLEQGGEDSFVVLSQIRMISNKRLSRRMRVISQIEFQQIKNKIRDFLI